MLSEMFQHSRAVSSVDMLMSENAKSSICILRYGTALSVMKCS